MEENYTTNSDTRTRRTSHNLPARYVNGVKLSDEEIADITEHNGRISKVKKNERKSKNGELLFSESLSSSAFSSARITQ